MVLAAEKITVFILWITTVLITLSLVAPFFNTVRVIVSWQHPSGQGVYQIDNLAISQRFRGCNKQATDIGTLRDYYLMVAKLRLRTAAV